MEIDHLDQKSENCWVPPSQREISMSDIHNLPSGTTDGDSVRVLCLDRLFQRQFIKALLRRVLAPVLAVFLHTSCLHHLENGTVKVPTPNSFSKGTGYEQKTVPTVPDAHQNPTQFLRLERNSFDQGDNIALRIDQ
jgi:hypothetical protein